MRATCLRYIQRTSFSTYRATKYSSNIITDKLNQFASKKMEQSREKNFSDMVTSMINQDRWTLRPWKQMMEEQLSSWMLYIPGVSGSKEVTELKGMKEILDSMTDEELDYPEKINGKAKERISTASKRSIDDVRMLLFAHKHSQIVFEWIKLKKAANEELPKDDWEMQTMMADDKRVHEIARRVVHATGRKGGKGARSVRRF